LTAEPAAAETTQEYPPHLMGLSPDEAYFDFIDRLDRALKALEEASK